VYDAIYCESLGKPTVTLAYQYFNNDAQSAASSKGMPVLRVVYEPIVSECTDMEEIESGVSGALEKVLAALTQPLNAEEKTPRSKEPERLERLVFKGDLGEVNRFFYKRGWTDGLPILPPTEEAVAEMLKGSDLAPSDIVATLVPRRGKATVEKIAINAVMAGALPTHLPLLIAGTRALFTNRGADMMAASTGSWSPFWVVNGPIRKDIHLNSSYGSLSPGDIANAAIGRAMGLITKNIRGIRKGIEDMGVLGNPGKYCMVAAEDEENSPWDAFHVEHGLKKEDSAITLSFPQSYDQFYPYGTDDKGLLATLIYNLTPIRMGVMNIILTPTNARSLAKRGWTKGEVKKFVLENARVAWYRHPRAWSTILSGSFAAVDRRQNLNNADSVRIIDEDSRVAEPIQIFVFGGMGSWVGTTNGGSISNTEKVDLPSGWAKLVQKYRDVVPTYVRY
jgi:hypothetical protein